jgi:hypothetical protein
MGFLVQLHITIFRHKFSNNSIYFFSALITFSGSFSRRINVHAISPQRTIVNPRRASLPLRSRNDSPCIMLNTPSTVHMIEAPQYIMARMPSFAALRFCTKYHTIVEITAAKAVITRQISRLLSGQSVVFRFFNYG